MAVNGQFDAKHIADVLNTFGCKISAKDLKQPTYEIIMPIYKVFLETCIGVAPILYETDPIDAILHFGEETVKNQSQSFQQIMLYGFLSFLLDICGLEVPMSDILCTNKKLIIKQLSSMINFAKFEGEELKGFHKIQAENLKFEEECALLRHTIEELSSKSYYLKGERTQKEESVQARKVEIVRLKEHSGSLSNDFKLLKQHERALEQEEAELEKQITSLKSRVSQYERKSKILERLIVKSPTRLIKECEKTDGQCTDLEELIKSKNKEIEASRRLLFEKEKFAENCSVVETIMQDFYAQDIVQANENVRQIEKISQDITNLNFESNKIESACNTLKNENEKVKKASQDIVADFDQKSFNINEKEKEINESIKQNFKEINMLESRKSDLIGEREALMEKTKIKMDAGLQSISDYNKNLEILNAQRDCKSNYVKELSSCLKKLNDETKVCKERIFENL